MAKNQLETNDSSLDFTSGEREDSGLQDLLSVAAKIKETPEDDEPAEAQGDESGVILFKAGDLGGDDPADDHDAMFGSFAGGLGAGFETPSDPITSPDLTPLGGEGRVDEASPAEIRPKTEEPKRSPMGAIALVLGLGLAAVGIVYMANGDKDKPAQQQAAQAEMSASDQDAAVGKAELPAEEPKDASAGQPVAPPPEPEPEPEPVALEGETEGVLGEDGLLAADGTDAADPMAQKAGLLDASGKPVTKPAGKWEGKTIPSSSGGEAPDADPDPEPDPTPAATPKDPEPDPLPSKPAGGGGNDDEVDCLLNPDLPKCGKSDAPKPKDEQILAPKLPDSLSQTQLKAGFNTAKSKAKACGSKFGAESGTKVKVHVSIEGSTGKVTSVSAQGEHAGTDLGKCVEDAVQGASFEQFKKPSQGADYSMIM